MGSFTWTSVLRPRISNPKTTLKSTFCRDSHFNTNNGRSRGQAAKHQRTAEYGKLHCSPDSSTSHPTNTAPFVSSLQRQETKLAFYERSAYGSLNTGRAQQNASPMAAFLFYFCPDFKSSEYFGVWLPGFKSSLKYIPTTQSWCLSVLTCKTGLMIMMISHKVTTKIMQYLHNIQLCSLYFSNRIYICICKIEKKYKVNHFTMKIQFSKIR